MENGNEEWESLSLVKSKEDKIILFYIEFGKGY